MMIELKAPGREPVQLAVVSAGVATSASMCERCPVKTCGDCPFGASLKANLEALTPSIASKTADLIKDSSPFSKNKSEPAAIRHESSGYVGGAGGGSVESSAYCDTCAKKHSADKVCESKKAA